MNLFSQWLMMNGYSAYIWPTYGLFIAVLVINVISIKRQQVQTQKKLLQWFKRL